MVVVGILVANALIIGQAQANGYMRRRAERSEALTFMRSAGTVGLMFQDSTSVGEHFEAISRRLTDDGFKVEFLPFNRSNYLGSRYLSVLPAYVRVR